MQSTWLKLSSAHRLLDYHRTPDSSPTPNGSLGPHLMTPVLELQNKIFQFYLLGLYRKKNKTDIQIFSLMFIEMRLSPLQIR